MIYLREIRREDISIINKFRNDRTINNMVAGTFRYINEEVDSTWFDNYIKQRNNTVRCAICLKENNDMIGLVYLNNIDWSHSRASLAIMIGDSTMRGRKIGTSACKELINHAFFDLNLNRLEVRVLETNTISQKLFNKLGFIQEGILRQVSYKNGGYDNQVLYSLLKEEFKSAFIREK